jgi:hypothetical protein
MSDWEICSGNFYHKLLQITTYSAAYHRELQLGSLLIKDFVTFLAKSM